MSRYADTCYVFNQQVAWFHCNGMLHSFLLKPNYSTGTYRVKKWKILQSETPDLRDSSMQFCMYDFDGSLLRETHPCFPLQLDGTELSVYIKKEDKIEKFTHEVNVDCLREKDFPKNTFQYYMKKDLELLFE